MPTRKALVFPPIQSFATSVVQVAAGGIDTSSFAAGALTAAVMGTGAGVVRSVHYVSWLMSGATQTVTLASALTDYTRAIFVPSNAYYAPTATGASVGDSCIVQVASNTTLSVIWSHSAPTVASVFGGYVIQFF